MPALQQELQAEVTLEAAFPGAYKAGVTALLLALLVQAGVQETERRQRPLLVAPPQQSPLPLQLPRLQSLLSGKVKLGDSPAQAYRGKTFHVREVPEILLVKGKLEETPQKASPMVIL